MPMQVERLIGPFFGGEDLLPTAFVRMGHGDVSFPTPLYVSINRYKFYFFLPRREIGCYFRSDCSYVVSLQHWKPFGEVSITFGLN